MNRGTWSAVVVAALCSAACGKESAKPKEDPVPSNGKNGGAKTPAPAADAAPAPSADPVDREVEVTSIHGDGARVRVRVPASWEERESRFVLTNEFGETVAAVQFSVMFESGASADDIARFPAIVDSGFEGKLRPNLNSGDPKLDAVRLELAVVEEGDLPDGRFKVGRITKPAGAEGPYREVLQASCIRGTKGGKAVAVQGWVPLDREQELGPMVVEACKTFAIVR